MTTRNANLVIDPSAKPANGIQYGNVIQWYGGPIEVELGGVFDSSSIDLVMCAKLPTNGKLYAADNVTLQVADTDWIALQTFTAAGRFHADNLNPCLLTTKVSSSGNATRVRGVVS